MTNYENDSWETCPIEQDAVTYSDLYKDLHGFRPSLEGFREMTKNARRAFISEISELLAQDIADDSDDDDHYTRYQEELEIDFGDPTGSWRYPEGI